MRRKLDKIFLPFNNNDPEEAQNDQRIVDFGMCLELRDQKIHTGYAVLFSNDGDVLYDELLTEKFCLGQFFDDAQKCGVDMQEVNVAKTLAHINTQGFQAKNIMAVDDEPEILDILRHQLEDLGHAVTLYDTMNLHELTNENKHFDLYILDQMIMGVRGTDIAVKIKEKDPLALIVLHTGCPDQAEEALKRCPTLQDGRVIVRGKPWEIEELLEDANFKLLKSVEDEAA